MIFAAGLGTRMGALTRDLPKPLVPLAGRPMIDHAIELARAAGLRKIVANLHYKSDLLAAHLAPLGVTLSLEQPCLLDTGGGLLNALALTGPGPVFTLNPDAVWRGPNPLTLLAEKWDPARMDALLLLVPRARALGHVGAGDFVEAPDGRLTRGPGQVYTGAQIVKTDRLTRIRSRIGADVFSLNLVWDVMLASGRLFGATYSGEWCDVGTPEGLARGERLIRDADV